MTEDVLLEEIFALLSCSKVRKMCRSYHAIPEDAMGELYVQLAPKILTKDIRCPRAWVNANGTGILRNYLYREY